MRDRYVWKDGHWRDPRTDQRMWVPPRDHLAMPTVRSDIEPYTSPIDGSLIGSRSSQRYDLDKNDCVLAPPGKPFIREEYIERKARQAKQLRKA